MMSTTETLMTVQSFEVQSRIISETFLNELRKAEDSGNPSGIFEDEVPNIKGLAPWKYTSNTTTNLDEIMEVVKNWPAYGYAPFPLGSMLRAYDEIAEGLTLPYNDDIRGLLSDPETKGWFEEITLENAPFWGYFEKVSFTLADGQVQIWDLRITCDREDVHVIIINGDIVYYIDNTLRKFMEPRPDGYDIL